jgi:hypothetical protein
VSADLQIVLVAGSSPRVRAAGTVPGLRRVGAHGRSRLTRASGHRRPFLLFETRRGRVPVIGGAAVFAVVCGSGHRRLAATGSGLQDAAIALGVPALFSLGVLGVQRYADDLHLDLDATIYGEIAFVPLQQWDVLGAPIRGRSSRRGRRGAQRGLVAALWKELKVTSFDPAFAQTAASRPGGSRGCCSSPSRSLRSPRSSPWERSWW